MIDNMTHIFYSGESALMFEAGNSLILFLKQTKNTFDIKHHLFDVIDNLTNKTNGSKR